MQLKGSKTEQHLKDAFAGESQANRRYLYFAAKADVEGYNDVAAVFRSTAEGETGHAHGHLEYLEKCGDPATGMPFGPTAENQASREDTSVTQGVLEGLIAEAARKVPALGGMPVTAVYAGLRPASEEKTEPPTASSVGVVSGNRGIRGF